MTVLSSEALERGWGKGSGAQGNREDRECKDPVACGLQCRTQGACAKGRAAGANPARP